MGSKFSGVPGLMQLGMRGMFVRLSSALQVIQSEVGRRCDFAD